ncbi:MAG: Rrf2 family transcriptional regulator [Erysipelotrichaceae bacterium]|nr:Rrf2 family transcriptional regulator [Erysipelotrichaceae bacterium]
MKYSTKVRYGLAVVMVLAEKNEITALITIANRLGLSKNYLEQVLFLLKSHQIVESIKGPSGGYKLINRDDLDLYMVFSALDSDLTDSTDEQRLDDHKLNLLLNNEVYTPIEETVMKQLKSIKIKDLVKLNQEEMYYI